MAKKIYRYRFNTKAGVMEKTDKLTVVYENKTFYFCKTCGSDNLRQVYKPEVNKEINHSGWSFYTDYELEIDSQRSLKIRLAQLNDEMNSLVEKRKRHQGYVDNFHAQILQVAALIEEVQDQLNQEEVSC